MTSELIVVSFKLPRDLNDFLEREARREGVTKSELIRRAIKNYLYSNGGRGPKVIVTRKMKIYL